MMVGRQEEAKLGAVREHQMMNQAQEEPVDGVSGQILLFDPSHRVWYKFPSFALAK